MPTSTVAYKKQFWSNFDILRGLLSNSELRNGNIHCIPKYHIIVTKQPQIPIFLLKKSHLNRLMSPLLIATGSIMWFGFACGQDLQFETFGRLPYNVDGITRWQ